MELNETEKLVAEFFINREGNEILDNIKEIDLIDEGILDSLDTVSLVDHLQKKFNKKIDITKYETLEAFRHFDDIVKLVS
jgi:acyl carrier protein